jgi:phosphoribosyl 1,2-cyclic phosphodiesterase
MRIRFWGVRGSLPSPETPAQIRDKIASVLEQAGPEDLASPESRKRFLAALPPWVFGTVGGNTSCVSLRAGQPEEELIFDAGSGIRELGLSLIRERPRRPRHRLFLSHYHWDHLQGLPFFVPAYDPAAAIDFYSPLPGLEAALRGQMNGPYFPVGLDAMVCKKNFHEMREPMSFSGLNVSFKKLNHPGDSYAFLVEDGKRRFVYATDTELTRRDFEKNGENIRFFQDTDLIIIDAQYTREEATDKNSWGHSAFNMAVDFAAAWRIKRLVLFHHDPSYDNQKISGILRAARAYAEKLNLSGTEIILALEGMEMVL